MDNIGDLLYFLMILVFAVIGIIGKKKKTSQTPQKKANVPDIPNTWEELEKHIFKKTEPAKQPATASPHTQSTDAQRQTYRTTHAGKPSNSAIPADSRRAEPEILSYDTVDDVRKMRAKKQVQESIFKKQDADGKYDLEKNAETAYRPIDIEFHNVDDVKKAFVFSEILNRKYS